MEITLDRASKFYEPGEKVTGKLEFKDHKFSDFESVTFKADCFMDTVSQIRGNMGRPPLDEKDKIYFMKKVVDYTESHTAPGKMLNFEFLLEATEADEKLLDVYVGVEFSIVVSKSISTRIN